MRIILIGAVLSAGFGILTKLKVLADSLSVATRIGSGGIAASSSLSMALGIVGAGFETWGKALGVFVAALIWMYRSTRERSKTSD